MWEGEPKGILSEIVDCVRRIFTVMAFCHSLNFMSNNRLILRVLFLVQSIYKVMSEIPYFFVAVPSPGGIRVRVMMAAAASV